MSDFVDRTFRTQLAPHLRQAAPVRMLRRWPLLRHKTAHQSGGIEVGPWVVVLRRVEYHLKGNAAPLAAACVSHQKVSDKIRALTKNIQQV